MLFLEATKVHSNRGVYENKSSSREIEQIFPIRIEDGCDHLQDKHLPDMMW